MVFFFDEAHLLFKNANKVLLEKIEQVVRLIRSKGVGIYFITQSPSDVPDSVLGQLGNRVQHALRAYTPKDQKAVRVAAQTFRSNPNLDVESVISTLGVGEALVSVLEENGVPSIVQRTLMRPPSSRMGPITADERATLISRSPCQRRYAQAIDPHSAHEVLEERTKARLAAESEAAERAAQEKQKPRRSSNRQSIGEALIKSVARSVGSSLGRSIGKKLVRGLLGSLLK